MSKSKTSCEERDIIRGRFTNYIGALLSREEITLDFYAMAGNERPLIGRFFLTPAHVVRLRNMLTKQIKAHKDTYGNKG